MQNQTPNKMGRKRDPSRDAAILEATLEVLSDTGYERLTTDLVAARAKAGKGALYRRWDSKEALVLDAVAHLKRKHIDVIPLPDTGTLRGDLLALFKAEPSEVAERKLKIFAGVSSMLSRFPDLGDSVNQVMAGPWIEIYQVLMKRARVRGEIPASADIPTLSQIVPSMAAYRALILRKPFNKTFLISMIDGVLMPALGISKKTKQQNRGN
jgi:AcrR family transcriptional regulator